MDSLIYNRTANDVEVALSNPNSSSFLKGAYNYTDLNRVETWGKYIQECLIPYGFKSELVWKTNWVITDYPTLTQINRIRNNVIAERDFLDLTNNILINNTMNYEQANELERVFKNIMECFDEDFYTSYSNNSIGAITAVNEYFTINGKETSEDFNIFSSLFVGFFLAINEYFKIQPKEMVE